MYGEPANLVRLAERLDARADQLQNAAHELVGAGDRTRWHSTAGEAMRRRAREMAQDFATVVANYRAAAEAVRAHARQLRAVLDLLEDIQRAFHRAVEAARDRIEQLGNAVKDGAEHVAESVGDGLREVGSRLGFGDGPAEPDPADVRLCSIEPPPPGHRDWLDLAPVAGVAR